VNTHSLRFRLTAWYAGLLSGALLLFGFSVYVGLQRYLEADAGRTLIERAHSIGAEITAEYAKKGPLWLAREIEEAYAPDINGNFIRVKRNGDLIYRSAAPRDDAFDPAEVPSVAATADAAPQTIVVSSGRRLLIVGFRLRDATGAEFLVETGGPYQAIDQVLHGLLLTFSLYVPLIVSLAVAGGYWLMRRSLRPVDEITTRAEGITSTNLSKRLPVIQTGDELERLSTSLNRMIGRLEDAFQHINRFSADASHELRTPLTILQLELEEIAQHRALPPDLADQIGSALEETQRLAHIVENLLTISRMDAGETRMDITVLDLAQLAVTTAEQMKLLADEKSIRLHCWATERTFVEGDRARLKQLIVNLVDNAIKYSSEGEIEVRVYAKDQAAILEVADTGLGIPAEALPHVFERFYRADRARSRESGGSGLGLAIAKAICTAHGAQISVASTEGVGSCVRVEMPLANAEAGQTLDLAAAVPHDHTVPSQHSNPLGSD
jgi:heavy metal sensor kinase